MPPTFLLSFQDMATVGLYVDALPARLFSPRRALQQVVIPGRTGAVVTSSQSAGARELAINGIVFNTSQSAADRQAAEDLQKDLLYARRVTVELSDGVNAARKIDGYVSAVEIVQDGPTLASPGSKWTITLLCPDAVWRDVNPRLIGLSGTARDVLIGTAPSSAIVRLMGADPAVVNPVFKLCDQTGKVVKTFTMTHAGLTDDDYVEQDCSTGQTTTSIDGVVTVDNTLLTAGERRFSIEPRFGYRQFGAYPTVELSATSGTPTGVLQYTPMWL